MYETHGIFASTNMSTPCCAAKPTPKVKDLEALTKVYAALADPTRLRILSLLGEARSACATSTPASTCRNRRRHGTSPICARPAWSRRAATASGCTTGWRRSTTRSWRGGEGRAARPDPHRRQRERRAAIAGGAQGVVITVLFACVHNAGRSQIAAALFNRYADPARRAPSQRARSRPRSVHPEVIEVMRSRGIDLSSQRRSD